MRVRVQAVLPSRWVRVGLGAVIAAAVSLAISGTAAADPGSGSEISSVPVTFHVVTKNRSGLPCADTPDGKHAVVRGHLTGPSSELDRNDVDGTLYSHGDGYGEYFWRYPGDEHYNYVEQMARRGHVSVTIDRLGYGDSDKPNGNSICFGAEADVLHQIVGQLRNGSYTGDRSPRFDKVGLVGHSASGLIVEQEAAGFHDIDALGVLDSGELNITPLALERAGEQQVRCLASPKNLVGLLDARSSSGYAALEADAQQFRADHIHNVDSDIADDLVKWRTKDACAGTRNAVQALAGNAARNSLIDVPVLLLAGAQDQLFSNPRPQAATYTHSKKVTVRVVPDAGHAVAFARTAPQFQDDMNDWLDRTGL
jgi:pimeloyl-ACP methyl ester carboxylesterase